MPLDGQPSGTPHTKIRVFIVSDRQLSAVYAKICVVEKIGPFAGFVTDLVIELPYYVPVPGTRSYVRLTVVYYAGLW